jgi:hypothetical protein
MQISRQDYFVERLLFYASHSIIQQAPKGKPVTTDAKGKKVQQPGYNIDGIYVIAILDFVLFKEKTAKDIIIEQIKLMRQEANKEFTDKLRFLIIELPKFRKKLSELVTVQDKLLFSLKHMDKLSERPAIMSEEIFLLMYEIARINKLTQRDMKTYNRSMKKYDDLLQAMSFAEREGEKRGERRGKRRGKIEGRVEGIEIGEKRGCRARANQKCQNLL